VLGSHAAWIHEVLEQDKQEPKKQRHTAKRIFDRLKVERGYAGGYTTAKDAVQECKARWITQAHANSLSLVRFDTNSDSVNTPRFSFWNWCRLRGAGHSSIVRRPPCLPPPRCHLAAPPKGDGLSPRFGAAQPRRRQSSAALQRW
jgi:hypothetical protein